MNSDIKEVLLSEEEIHKKVKELGQRISEDYKGKNLHMVSVLKGAIVFMADLMRSITIPVSIDFVSLSSYGSSTESSGEVRVLKDLDASVEGLDLLVIEDILDTGVTLSSFIEMLKKRNPNSVKVCALLNKPDRRKKHVDIDYEGFVIPDAFVVGYGLDYDEKYRNLPYVGVLDPKVYS